MGIKVRVHSHTDPLTFQTGDALLLKKSAVNNQSVSQSVRPSVSQKKYNKMK